MTFRGPVWFVRATVSIGTVATVASLVLLYLDITGRLTSWTQTAVTWTDTAPSEVSNRQLLERIDALEKRLTAIVQQER